MKRVRDLRCCGFSVNANKLKYKDSVINRKFRAQEINRRTVFGIFKYVMGFREIRKL